MCEWMIRLGQMWDWPRHSKAACARAWSEGGTMNVQETEGNLKYVLEEWEVGRYESKNWEFEFDPEDDEKEVPDSHGLSHKQVSDYHVRRRASREHSFAK